MKILKKAEQKNFVIDRAFRTVYDLNLLLALDYAFYFKQVDGRTTGVFTERLEETDQDTVVRLYASQVKDLSVVYNKDFGLYLTAATTHSGLVVYVAL